ncbi:hypothetical protein INR49_028677 [Caranx melampygus]|nr:hypothetical protein INR49_028677 [Caranx melampygus]
MEVWLQRLTVVLFTAQSSEYTTNPSLVTSEQVPVKRQLPFAWWIWVVLAVSAFILIILLITYASLRSRCINSTADDPVYANTRPVANKQPSPRPGAQVDTLKKVSSSQNLKTPNSGRRYEEGKRRQKL